MRHQFTARLLSQNVQYNIIQSCTKKSWRIWFHCKWYAKRMQNTHNVSATNHNFHPIEVLHKIPQKKVAGNFFALKRNRERLENQQSKHSKFYKHLLNCPKQSPSACDSPWCIEESHPLYLGRMVWSSFSKPKMVILFWDDITTKTSPKYITKYSWHFKWYFFLHTPTNATSTTNWPTKSHSRP